MKRMLILMAVCGIFVGGTAVGQQGAANNQAAQARYGEIRHMLDLSGAGNMGVQMMGQIMGSFKRAMPQVPAEFWDKFAKKVNSDEMIELIVPIYAKYLTDEDVKGIIVFYESPVGKKFTKVQPQIVRESYAVGQQWGMKIGQQVMQELQAAGYSLPQAAPRK